MSRGGRRGRGRGKSFGSTLESLRLPPGEAAPSPILQPPSLYPSLERRPLELNSSDVDDYLVTIKQESKRFMVQSPFYLTASSETVEIVRYSDRYKTNGDRDRGMGWDINWTFFPKELHLGRRRKRTGRKERDSKSERLENTGTIKNEKTKEQTVEEVEEEPNESLNPKRSKIVTWQDEVVKKLEILEKTEQSSESEQSAGEEEDNLYNDEDEEGTDYNLTYFDNGEDYEMRDDEALEEGPIY